MLTTMQNIIPQQATHMSLAMYNESGFDESKPKSRNAYKNNSILFHW